MVHQDQLLHGRLHPVTPLQRLCHMAAEDVVDVARGEVGVQERVRQTRWKLRRPGGGERRARRDVGGVEMGSGLGFAFHIGVGNMAARGLGGETIRGSNFKVPWGRKRGG